MHQITPGKTRRVIPQRAIQTNIRFSNGVSIALASFYEGKDAGAHCSEAREEYKQQAPTMPSLVSLGDTGGRALGLSISRGQLRAGPFLFCR